MKEITALMLLFASASIVTANENADHAMHQADVFVDGSTVDIDPDLIKQFTSDLQGGQVAVVSVMGMVRDRDWDRDRDTNRDRSTDKHKSMIQNKCFA